MVLHRKLIGKIMNVISNFFKLLLDISPKKNEVKDDNMLSTEEANELLDLHNKTRDIYDIPPLSMDQDCTLVAQSHATWMANAQNVSHMGFSFFGPVQRVAIVGKEPEYLGECISYGITLDVKELMKTWFTSESHKEIILGRYDRFGVGRATGYKDKNIYWCAIYCSSTDALNVPKLKMSDSLVDFKGSGYA